MDIMIKWCVDKDQEEWFERRMDIVKYIKYIKYIKWYGETIGPGYARLVELYVDKWLWYFECETMDGYDG